MVAIVESVYELLGNQPGVIVHCGAGIGRAGTIAVATLIRFGFSASEALATVYDAREGAGPESGLQAEFIRRYRQN